LLNQNKRITLRASVQLIQVICAIEFSERLNFAFLGVQGANYKKILRKSYDKIRLRAASKPTSARAAGGSGWR